MRKKKKKYWYIVIAIIFLTVLVPYRFTDNNHFFSSISEQVYDKTLPIRILNEQKQSHTEIFNVNLYSQNAIVIGLNDNEIIFKKNSEDKIYPASLTKIMTAIVAIENISNLQQKVILPKRMFQDLYTANASMAGYLPNEEVTALDLLYGTMLPSGAEAAIGLANDVAGSEHQFVTLMNEKAKQLGMKNTYFTNTTGLHDSDHFTTVKDISILLEYALEDEIFRAIFTSPRHSTSPTNLHPNGMTFYSTMFKNINTTGTNGAEIIGGKTGYTEQAGLCLASLAEKNGQEFIMVTAGADGNHKTEQYNLVDAFAIYDKVVIE
ncbi:MAG: D-alanyl-D-alanine carboxypeptidase [Bacillus sp. (in: Bacteria)]|nr:D-alanyl-D-alanine carboxypeptidase [Bacillus sp. (in: firmicutes)]